MIRKVLRNVGLVFSPRLLLILILKITLLLFLTGRYYDVYTGRRVCCLMTLNKRLRTIRALYLIKMIARLSVIRFIMTKIGLVQVLPSALA